MGKPFSKFFFARGRVAPGAPKGVRQRVPGMVSDTLLSMLLNGGYGYENHLRSCFPLAIHHRV
jgi:hypothetical protein